MKLNRREFLGTAAVGSAMLPHQNRRANGRPNILLLVSDQEREDVSPPLLNVPNRRALEERGIRFANAFCTTPQCSPSRASLFTGLYPHEAGVITNVDGSSLSDPLPPQIPNLGKVFQENGYRTGYLGKWHLGNDSKGLESFGFPDYRRVRGQELAVAASDWIQAQSSSQPWLLVVSFINPHDIYFAHERPVEIRPGVTLPDNFNDDLRKKPPPQLKFLSKDQGKLTLNWGEEDWLRYRSYYLDLIEGVDRQVGTIMTAVKAKGALENTLVVYTSDHGDMGGSHRLPYKGPFMYEELFNVPLVISYPERFSSPVASDSLVSLVDLVPTVSALAGIDWPAKLSGRNLGAQFDEPTREVREAVFGEYYSKQHWVQPIRTIREQRWKYNYYVHEDAEELYDLNNDAGELNNLAEDSVYSEVRRRLSDRLLNWRRERGDPLLNWESWLNQYQENETRSGP